MIASCPHCQNKKLLTPADLNQPDLKTLCQKCGKEFSFTKPNAEKKEAELDPNFDTEIFLPGKYIIGRNPIAKPNETAIERNLKNSYISSNQIVIEIKKNLVEKDSYSETIYNFSFSESRERNAEKVNGKIKIIESDNWPKSTTFKNLEKIAKGAQNVSFDLLDAIELGQVYQLRPMDLFKKTEKKNPLDYRREFLLLEILEETKVKKLLSLDKRESDQRSNFNTTLETNRKSNVQLSIIAASIGLLTILLRFGLPKEFTEGNGFMEIIPFLVPSLVAMMGPYGSYVNGKKLSEETQKNTELTKKINTERFCLNKNFQLFYRCPHCGSPLSDYFTGEIKYYQKEEKKRGCKANKNCTAIFV